MRVNDQQVIFNMLDVMKSPDDVEDCNFISVVDFTIAERLNNCCSNEEIKAVTFEEFEDKDLETTDIAWLRETQRVRTNKHFESLYLPNREVKFYVPSIESPLVLESKLLLSHLKYVYRSDHDTLSIIISSSLNAEQEKSLIYVFGRYKKTIR